MDAWKYLLVGIVVPIFWAIVFALTRRFAPSLMTPVGVAWKRLLHRQRQ